MKTLRKLSIAAAALGMLAVSMTSNATIVSASTNNPLSFSWSQTVLGNDGQLHTLTGFGSMTLSGFNSSYLFVSISLTNTSSIVGQGGERLAAFGFGIDPNATSVAFFDSADAGMQSAQLGANFPQFQAVDVCAAGNLQACSGGNAGIFAGASDAFVVRLGGTWGSSVNIDPIALKYQTGYGSFEFSTSSSSGRVPEPGSMALLGLGLVGMAFVARRRKVS